MATVLYLKDTKFNNPQLPKVHPFTINGFIADGLVMAFMPQNSPASLTDLSGNGVVLTQIGKPTWYPTGVKGWWSTGFRSDVKVTPSWTSMCVSRRHPGTDLNNTNGPYRGSNLLVNGYIATYTGSNIKKDPAGNDITGNVGNSMYKSVEMDTEGGTTYRDRVRVPQCYGIEYSTGAAVQTQNVYGNTKYTLDNAGNNSIAPWDYQIGGVSATEEALRGMYVDGAGVVSSRTADHTSYPDLIGPGTYSNRIMYDQCWNLFCPDKYDSGWTSTGVMECACFAVWDRLLSMDEMRSQYEVMSALLKEQRGIIV